MTAADLRVRSYEMLAFFVPLCAYVLFAMPDVGLWDTGEMATVPYIFGIAHPTGFPLYVVLGFIFSHVFAVGGIAWRMAIFSAVCTALACWLLFRTARRYAAPPFALFATLIFALGSIAWTRATRPEVHTAALLGCALAVALALAVRERKLGAAFALPLVFASAIAVHPVAIWIFPGVALLVIATLRGADAPLRDALVRRLALGSLAGAVAFCAAYATVPWRSMVATSRHLDPTVQLGFAAGMPFWDYGHPSTPAQFLWFMRGAQFAPGSALLGFFSVPSYPSYLATVLPSMYHEFPLGLLFLAAVGFIAIVRRDRAEGAALLLLAICGLPFAAQYHIEIDSDRYLLVSFWVLAVALAAGLHALYHVARSRKNTPYWRLTAGGSGLMLAVSGALAVAYFSAPAMAHANTHEGRDVIRRIVRKTPDNAIIVSSWVYATPLAYAAYVEHSLGRRVVVAADSDGIADRFPKLAKARPLFLIDDKVPPFTDANVLLITRVDDFPLLVEVRAKSRHQVVSLGHKL